MPPQQFFVILFHFREEQPVEMIILSNLNLQLYKPSDMKWTADI